MGKYSDRKSAKTIKPRTIIGAIEIAIGIIGLILMFFPKLGITNFFLGLCGMLSFPIFLLLALFGVKRMRNLIVNVKGTFITLVCVGLILLICLIHTIFSSKLINTLTLGEYINALFKLTYSASVGGVVIGIPCGLLGSVLGSFGTIIVLTIVFLIVAGFTIDYAIQNKYEMQKVNSQQKPRTVKDLDIDAGDLKVNKQNNYVANSNTFVTKAFNNDYSEPDTSDDEIINETESTEDWDNQNNDDDVSQPKTAREILFGANNTPNVFDSTDEERRSWLNSNSNLRSENESTTSNNREYARNTLFGHNISNNDMQNDDEFHDNVSNLSSYQSNRLFKQPINTNTDAETDVEEDFNLNIRNPYLDEEDDKINENQNLWGGRNPQNTVEPEEDMPQKRSTRFSTDLTQSDLVEELSSDDDDVEDNSLNRFNPRNRLNRKQQFEEQQSSETIRAPRSEEPISPRRRFATDNEEDQNDNVADVGNYYTERVMPNRAGRASFSRDNLVPKTEQTEIWQAKKEEKVQKQPPRDVRYNPPPVSLLKENKDDPSKYSKNYEENAKIIEQKLDEFRIPAKVVGVVRGPTVTRYELSMPSGIPVKKILNYDMDLSMALKTKQTIRIEAPIPGKNAVGVETPNDPRSMVTLRELIESKEFQNSSMALPVAIGKDINGEVIVKNLAKMVHVLVAGSTGSGKSVFLHSVIMSLMFKLSPSELRFIMIDPKRVEFSRYRGMPHMMLSDVVSDATKAINSLQWAVKEMERRYSLLEKNSCQNIAGFNESDAVKNGDEAKLPYLVIIVDELAELMNVAKKEVETAIQRIAQLGRASGIHLVIATQRPSVDVITGTIKANLPNRIAFALTNYIDSKTILDEPGAEKLLGQGDMLFSAQDSNTSVRLQAAYVSDAEIDRCVDFIKRNNETHYDEEVMKAIYAEKEEDLSANVQTAKEPTDHSDQMDELLPAALKLFIESKKGSINMVQRRFYVGYSRAARIVDQMEVRGYVSSADGSKNREILINMDDFRQIFGDDV